MNDTDIAKLVAANVVRLSLKKGFSQSELATRLGFSRGAVTRLLKNQRMPTADMLAKLSEVFGVQPAELLRDEEKRVRRKV